MTRDKFIALINHPGSNIFLFPFRIVFFCSHLVEVVGTVGTCLCYLEMITLLQIMTFISTHPLASKTQST